MRPSINFIFLIKSRQFPSVRTNEINLHTYPHLFQLFLDIFGPLVRVRSSYRKRPNILYKKNQILKHQITRSWKSNCNHYRLKDLLQIERTKLKLARYIWTSNGAQLGLFKVKIYNDKLTKRKPVKRIKVMSYNIIHHNNTYYRYRVYVIYTFIIKQRYAKYCEIGHLEFPHWWS